MAKPKLLINPTTIKVIKANIIKDEFTIKVNRDEFKDNEFKDICKEKLNVNIITTTLTNDIADALSYTTDYRFAQSPFNNLRFARSYTTSLIIASLDPTLMTIFASLDPKLMTIFATLDRKNVFNIELFVVHLVVLILLDKNCKVYVVRIEISLIKQYHLA